MIVLDGSWKMFAGGALGVLLVEGAKVAQQLMTNSGTESLRKYADWRFWLGFTLLLAISGAVTVVTATSDSMPLFTALQLGINAPAIVSAIATTSEARGKRPKRPTAGLGGMPGQRTVALEPPSFLTQLLRMQSW